jgi:hypothetical protein
MKMSTFDDRRAPVGHYMAPSRSNQKQARRQIMTTPIAFIYQNNNYGGASQALTLGYNAGPLAIGNDVVSSVKVPRGLRVTLYEHAPGNGRTKVLTADTPSLPDFDNITSNILVEEILPTVPVYRLFCAPPTDHLYTNDAAERDLRLSGGWIDEGVACNLFYSGASDRKPLFRLFSMSRTAHTVTSDPAERDQLIAQGWVGEGTLGYVQTSPGIELHRMIRDKTQNYDVVLTTNVAERDKLLAGGWRQLSSPGNVIAP